MADYGQVLFAIMVSSKGYSIFNESIRKTSRELTNALDQFLDRVQKDPALATSLGVSATDLKKQVDSFKSKLANIALADYEQVVKNMRQTYMIGNTIPLEGFMLAVFDFLKEYLQFYYDLVKLEQGIRVSASLKGEIYKILPKQIEQNEDLFKHVFPNIKGFQPIPESPQEKLLAIQQNKALVFSALDPEDLTPLAKFIPAKEIEKLKKNLGRRRSSAQFEILDRFESLDKQIMTIIEELVFNMLNFQKNLISKEIRTEFKKRATQ